MPALPATCDSLFTHPGMGNGQSPGGDNPALNATLCDVNARDWVCTYRDRQSRGTTLTG
jgi:hypothetical protein